MQIPNSVYSKLLTIMQDFNGNKSSNYYDKLESKILINPSYHTDRLYPSSDFIYYSESLDILETIPEGQLFKEILDGYQKQNQQDLKNIGTINFVYTDAPKTIPILKIVLSNDVNKAKITFNCFRP